MSESNNTEQTEQTEQITAEPVEFGQPLKIAREKAGVSLEEAASSLHLEEKIVIALEQSDMEQLPPVTFVKGYLRAYARLLDLDESSVLADFDRAAPHEMETELQPRSPLPAEAHIRTPAVMMVTLSVIVVAVVLFVYAAYTYYAEKSSSFEQQAQVSADEDTDQAERFEAVNAEQSAAVVDDQSTVEELLPLPAVTAVNPAPGVESGENEAGTGESTAPESVAPEQAVTDADIMTLKITEECWAKISDVNGTQVFYGTLRAGSTMELTGRQPFDVFLGNAPAVSMELNGQAVDMTNRIRSNKIARFKVASEQGRIRVY